MIASPFFRCRLHGTRIVTRFPVACPLGRANPLAQLGRIRDGAWRAMGVENYGSAEARFAMFDVCSECLDRGLRARHVEFLRKKMTVVVL